MRGWLRQVCRLRPSTTSQSQPQTRFRKMPGTKRCPHHRNLVQMTRFIQINLNRSLLACELLHTKAAEDGANILIISKQPRGPLDGPRRVSCLDGNCGIVLTRTANITIELSGSETGQCWIQSGPLRIYSFYLSPNQTLTDYNETLLSLESSIRQTPPDVDVIVAGDFNAKSYSWGSAREDAKSQALAELAVELDLQIVISGDTPTFRRWNSQSVIDVTYVRLGRLVVEDWRVLYIDSASDHNYIRFTLTANQGDPLDLPQESRPGWAYRKLDAPALENFLRSTQEPAINTDTTAEEAASMLHSYLKASYDSCMPPRSPYNNRRKPVHWWSAEIAEQRAACLRASCCYQRAARRHELERSNVLRADYRAQRKKLALLIKTSKEKCWSDLCDAVDNEGASL